MVKASVQIAVLVIYRVASLITDADVMHPYVCLFVHGLLFFSALICHFCLSFC